MYRLRYSSQFRKDIKLCQRKGLDLSVMQRVISILVRDGKLPKEYRPHILHVNRQGQWECHIKSDCLLVWEQNDEELTLLMVNTGTHSDLFK